MNTKGFVYQFTNKAGSRVYFNPKTEEWAIEIDWSHLVEPTIKETTEILQYIVETAMDSWGEVLLDK